MEFIKVARRKSFLASSMHVLLNIALVAMIWLSIWVTGSPFVAVGLVLMSKWRVFAVRPRFWAANVKSNLVDLIVCLSLTGLMWASGAANISISTVILATIYIVWLIAIKPQSKKIFIDTQAIFSIFIGFFALFVIGYNWSASAIVILAWLIGYSAFRHVLAVKEHNSLEILSLMWGLILAEIGWVFNHWTVGYPLFGISSLAVPQVAIIAAVLSFLVFSMYRAKEDDSKISFQEIILPLLFTLAVFVVVMGFFSSSPQI
ncbi:hypothetical protein EOM27_01950 [Candidatus Saccharibacteria bacterium]|jgi:hypothetical protein|nr:hypothetical protein [Candidatus Saccharibacteria bacterium]NCU43719.1 hypothetical protein [Candidatus Saccharibacteria bacterium]